MQLLEKEIEDAIYKASDKQLREHGLKGVVGDGVMRRFRQLDLGTMGRADLVFVNRQHHPYTPALIINIIELKRDDVGTSALGQALRYAYAIQSFLKGRGVTAFGFRITLIGRTSSDNFMYLPHLVYGANNSTFGRINSIDVYKIHYDINGLYFDNTNIGREQMKFEGGLCTTKSEIENDGALPF